MFDYQHLYISIKYCIFAVELDTMGYIYIFLTIFFTVYGQLVIKWRMPMKGQLPEELMEKIRHSFFIF